MRMKLGTAILANGSGCCMLFLSLNYLWRKMCTLLLGCVFPENRAVEKVG